MPGVVRRRGRWLRRGKRARRERGAGGRTVSWLRRFADVKRQPEPYPLNVPGPFYVENGLCISCRVPEHEAPDLIGFDEDPSGTGHCYFKKQPETSEEMERAINAMSVACCGAHCYGGDDPDIIRRLR